MDQPLTPASAATDQAAGGMPNPAAPTSRVLALIQALGAGRLLVLAATALGLMGLFAYLLLRVTEPHYTLLYGDLDLADSGQIVGRLEALGVPYRLQGDGAAILVPADRALRLRMTLAEEGLPQGGSVGDEIFDQQSALGTTNFLANVNLRRALEGELARTIASLAAVKAARVHLVMPRRELFRREQIEPSASVTLTMIGNQRLDRRQVQAVQHLVAAAVPGLMTERIALVDHQGTLLARGGDGDAAEAVPTQADEFREAYERRLKRTVEEMLERSLGPGRVHAEVNADLDFDQITVTEETYDPDGQVVRSTQTIEEESQLAERDEDDNVTVANNLPNAGADAAAGRTSNENTTRSEETINYEISRTMTNHVQVGGRVRRLSVAVLVDGRMVPDEDGVPVYTPLATEELEEIATLVRSAIGFDEARGDIVEVRNMRFAALPEGVAEEDWTALGEQDVLRLVEVAALVLVALMMILMVVRPTMRLLAQPPTPALAGAPGETAALPGGQPAPTALPASTSRGEGETAGVEVDGGDGRMGGELVKQARSVVEQAPDEAAGIVRSWLHGT